MDRPSPDSRHGPLHGEKKARSVDFPGPHGPHRQWPGEALRTGSPRWGPGTHASSSTGGRHRLTSGVGPWDARAHLALSCPRNWPRG
eukprot:15451552-Alexandrium_andersonii.AAC.1